jgi:hypothetical protein
MAEFYVTMVKDCEDCSGQGGAYAGPPCPSCQGAGTEEASLELTEALRSLGILDRLAALESAVHQVERTAGRAAYTASALANGIYPD